jgi:hypothetical protein
MRPKIAMWSDYGAPRHKHWRTPSRRSKRSSIGPNILVAAVVVAAAIAVYPHIVDSEWVHKVSSQVKRAAVAEVKAARRMGLVTAVPLSPRRDATTVEAATSTPRAAPAVGEPLKAPSTVVAVERPANETAPTSAEAEAVADPLSNPAATPLVTPAQRNVARAPVAKRRVVRTERHRGYSGAYAQYGGGWGGWPGLGSPYRF